MRNKGCFACNLQCNCAGPSELTETPTERRLRLGFARSGGIEGILGLRGIYGEKFTGINSKVTSSELHNVGKDAVLRLRVKSSDEKHFSVST